ncbi:tachylectin-2-like [Ambystoma mexicanum]|uniref:tachylectin-2-like n=1 Tax=Ambystoma mexicanum TaxID=8296 RepID=UPI0037E7E3E7
MSCSDVILFAVHGKVCKAGLPPAHYLDNYNGRALVLGSLENPSHVFFSPDGRLYVVQGSQLFTGPIPSNPSKNWLLDVARCVGKNDWRRFKFLFFHPNGSLYAATHQGELYTGPPPTNENVPWLYTEATKIGLGGWDQFYALFFDPQGVLHAVSKDKFVKKLPPIGIDENWFAASQTIGLGTRWSELSHFMSFSPDGNLWCVSKGDGKIYTAAPPTHALDDWQSRAQNLGIGYLYRLMAFTRDKTIKSVVSLDFQPDVGEVLSTVPEVVAQQVYDNKKSTSPLNATFTFSKTYAVESAFSHEHGFTMDAEAELSFTVGVPFIAEGGFKIAISTSTAHNWSFAKVNRTETQFSMSQTFQVDPGKAVCQKAVVQKAKLIVPYVAKFRTLFDSEVTIQGTWEGATYFNLNVVQEDV